MTKVINNPYKKSAPKPMPKPTPKPKPKPPSKPRYGTAHASFINSTRLAIDDNPKTFEKVDWHNIQHCTNITLASKKKNTAKCVYVKSIAAWKPHLMLLGIKN